jgi:anti-anti-sigma factor
MAITLEHRRVGDITVVTCAGRIVDGPEAIALQKLLDEQLVYGPRIVLHLGAVDFLDSSGLGLLVRYVTRTRNADGALKVCAMSPRIVEVLEITRLRPIFEAYESEADAISAFYQRRASGGAAMPLQPDILCVDPSSDVQAYVRSLLAQAGYGVLTASNIPDGLVLLQATSPKVVIMGSGIRAISGTRSAEKFHALAAAGVAIVLPAEFSRLEAAEAGQQVLDQVRAAIPRPQATV